MSGCANEPSDFERDYYVEQGTYFGFLDPSTLPELIRYGDQYTTSRVYKVNDSLVWILASGRERWYDGPYHSLLSPRDAFMYIRDRVSMNESDLAVLLGFNPGGVGDGGE